MASAEALRVEINAQLVAENRSLLARVEVLKQWVNDLQSGMLIICVYCGHSYGPAASHNPAGRGTAADALTDHISTCPEHPLTAAKARVAELEALINSPEIIDFTRAVVFEAAHQRLRWDDAGKVDFDWFTVGCYLASKAMWNPPEGGGEAQAPPEKQLHRIITVAALMANWHAAKLKQARPDAGGEPPPARRSVVLERAVDLIEAIRDERGGEPCSIWSLCTMGAGHGGACKAVVHVEG